MLKCCNSIHHVSSCTRRNDDALSLLPPLSTSCCHCHIHNRERLSILYWDSDVSFPSRVDWLSTRIDQVIAVTRMFGFISGCIHTKKMPGIASMDNPICFSSRSTTVDRHLCFVDHDLDQSHSAQTVNRLDIVGGRFS